MPLKKQAFLTFSWYLMDFNWVSLVDLVQLHLFTFIVFIAPCCDFRRDFRVKLCSVFLYFQLNCMGFMFYLHIHVSYTILISSDTHVIWHELCILSEFLRSLLFYILSFFVVHSGLFAFLHCSVFSVLHRFTPFGFPWVTMLFSHFLSS
jgi:hypothetical protein